MCDIRARRLENSLVEDVHKRKKYAVVDRKSSVTRVMSQYNYILLSFFLSFVTMLFSFDQNDGNEIVMPEESDNCSYSSLKKNISSNTG